MAQKLIQTQEQKLQQLQKLSAQQMLQVKLLEMPLTELEDSINAELDDNPALESENPDDMLANDTNENDYLPEDNDSHNNDEEDDYEAQTEKEEREDALDSALENIGRDDLMPDYNSDRNNKQDADYEEMVYGDTISFYDKLKEQMDMQMLDDTEKQIMEYLIGSLDDDGLLRKDLDSICDELAIYQNIDVSEQKLEKILHILQTFDPAGIGAKNLQECLLLQVKRMPKGVLRKSMEEVFTDYYDEFTKKHWDKIKTGLELNDTQLATLQEEIRKLNPKPGASLGETEGRNLQQITPDFIVDTNDDGTVTSSRHATMFLAVAALTPATRRSSGAEAVFRSTPTLFTQSSTTPSSVSFSRFWGMSCWYWPTPTALGSILTSSASGSCRRRAIDTALRRLTSYCGNSSAASLDAE